METLLSTELQLNHSDFHHTVYGNWHGLIQMLETQWKKAAGVFPPLKSGLSQFAVF